MVVRSASDDGTLDLSVLLRPVRTDNLELMRLVIPFSTSEGIRKDTGIITWIGWPNRVTTEGRTAATTSMTRGLRGRQDWIVLTSRIRTGRSSHDESEVSLWDLLGVEVEPTLLTEKVLESLSWMYDGFLNRLDQRMMQRVASMVDLMGTKVEAFHKGGRVAGTLSGVDDVGRLILKLPRGGASMAVEDVESLREQ